MTRSASVTSRHSPPDLKLPPESGISEAADRGAGSVAFSGLPEASRPDQLMRDSLKWVANSVPLVLDLHPRPLERWACSVLRRLIRPSARLKFYDPDRDHLHEPVATEDAEVRHGTAGDAAGDHGTQPSGDRRSARGRGAAGLCGWRQRVDRGSGSHS